MIDFRRHLGLPALTCAALLALAPATFAVEASQGFEQALQVALQDKRGVTLFVNGQSVGGAVTRIEPGQWVELRNQTSGKVMVRLDRIDAIVGP